MLAHTFNMDNGYMQNKTCLQHFYFTLGTFCQISVVSSKRRITCAVECGMAVQGHPRSLILALI